MGRELRTSSDKKQEPERLKCAIRGKEKLPNNALQPIAAKTRLRLNARVRKRMRPSSDMVGELSDLCADLCVHFALWQELRLPENVERYSTAISQHHEF